MSVSYLKVLPNVCPNCGHRTFASHGVIGIRRGQAQGEVFPPRVASGTMYVCTRCNYRTILEGDTSAAPEGTSAPIQSLPEPAHPTLPMSPRIGRCPKCGTGVMNRIGPQSRCSACGHTE